LVVPKVAKSDYAKLYNFLEGKSQAQTIMLADNSSDRKNGNTHSELKYHRVRKGEKLNEIALHYNVEARDLLAWNNLTKGMDITGRNLLVSAVPATKEKHANIARSNSDKANNYYIAYKVKSGDTLDAIAKQFKGSTVSSLKAMNGLTSNSV